MNAQVNAGERPTANVGGKADEDWTALANERFPRAWWISGDGPIAVIAWCRPPGRRNFIRVSLHHDAAEARTLLDEINMNSCGDSCQGKHSISDLRLPRPLNSERESR